MKRLSLFFAIALAMVACVPIKPATGAIVEHTINLNNEIDALAVASYFNVVVDPTLPRGKVIVTTHTDMLDVLDIRNEGTTLNIDLKPIMLRAKTLNVRVPAYDYSAVAVSGGAYLKWKGCNVPSLTVAVSGGADLELETTSNELILAASGGSDTEITAACKSISLAASGGSDTELKGSSQQLSIAASGSSDVDASELYAENVEVTASGGSDVDVYATNSLTAHASGGSDISYAGNPTTMNIEGSGGSDIKPTR